MATRKDKIVIGFIIGGSVLFFIIFVIVIFLTALRTSGEYTDDGLGLKGLGGKVVLVEIDGIIENSNEITNQIKRFEEDNTIKAMVLRIDSPGGGVAASQEIFEQLNKFRVKNKPIVVSMGSVAASGGYYIACAADSIIANPGTITGSIGVIFSFNIFDTLMSKVGIQLEVFKSGEMKDVGNYARQVSPEERAMLQKVIDDTYEQFIKVVSDSRGLDIDSVKMLADGSIFTGQQALQLGLIDRLGSLQDAISLAGEMSDLGNDPTVVKQRRQKYPWWEPVFEKLGLDVKNLPFLKKYPLLEYRFSI